MYVDIGDVVLFFDTDGAKLVGDGPDMRERPTLLLLHGGPGFDHSHLKVGHGPLAEHMQLVYYDHRGNGRSGAGTRDKWNLAQWGDDVHSFCRALGIEKPVVLGLSFGGFVAQSYALRHPDHPAKLILSSTAGKMRFDRVFAMFERMGGPEARKIAEDFWRDASVAETLGPYLETCFPLYNQTPQNPDFMARAVINPDVLGHFFGVHGEGRRFDFLPALSRIRCPTLVMAGEIDPVTPVEQAEDLVAALPSGLVRFERFAGCGHGVERDDQAAALSTIRDFILE